MKPASRHVELMLAPANRRAFAAHARVWLNNRYVYPVVSRRSGGISIGVNLNPDKVCNFDCIYCQVDRHTPAPPESGRVDPAVVAAELRQMLELVHSGKLFDFEPFDAVAPQLRHLHDVAFSGDGEPTTCRQFPECCRLAAAELRNAALMDVKIVVITNATMFHRPQVRQALAFLDMHNGEIWAKLDAGTQAYYRLVDRTNIPLRKVLENILWCARTRPTVIQTLLLRVRHQPPPETEITAYIERLKDIIAKGGQIKLVQIYTVARRTAEVYATALSAKELAAIARRVRAELSSISVEFYP